MIIYADDPDAFVDFVVHDRLGGDLDWPTPTVAIGPGDYEVAATWQGAPGSPRTLRVPVDALEVGARHIYLQVPEGNDFLLGTVTVRNRR